MRQFLLLLLSFLSLTLQAQQPLALSVEEFAEDPFDLSAKNEAYEKIDGNGSRYAIIKVTSADPEDDLKAYQFNFGNLRHEVVMRDGVAWVYVQRNAKTVTISRSGYRSVARYDLGLTIETGKNYVMMLRPQEKMVQKQLVIFNISPADAKAVIMTRREGCDAPEELFGVADENGSAAKNMEFGSYTYTITSDYYKRSEGRFTLNQRNATHTEKVTLRPNFTTVTLSVEGDAKIFIDAQEMGTSPWTGRLKKGEYQVECRLEGHRPTSQRLKVADEPTINLNLKAPKPIFGTLVVLSNPLGASISIDGKNYGKTPLSKEVIIGTHEVKLSKDGYADLMQKVVVKEGESTELSEKMNKQKDTDKTSAKAEASEPGEKKTDKNTTPLGGKYKYFKRTTFYADAGAHLGAPMRWNVAIGGYLKNFNLEVDYAGHIGESKYDGNENFYFGCLSSSTIALKIGYGFIAKPRFRITPQIGVDVIKFQNSSIGSYNIGILAGARMEIPFNKHLGLSFAPEICFKITEGSKAAELKGYYSDLDKLNCTYGGKIGLYFCF